MSLENMLKIRDGHQGKAMPNKKQYRDERIKLYKKNLKVAVYNYIQ